MAKELYDRIASAERRGKSVILKPVDLMLLKKALWAADVEDQGTFEDAVLAGSRKACGCGNGLAGAAGICDDCFIGRDSRGGSMWRPSGQAV